MTLKAQGAAEASGLTSGAGGGAACVHRRCPYQDSAAGSPGIGLTESGPCSAGARCLPGAVLACGPACWAVCGSTGGDSVAEPGTSSALLLGGSPAPGCCCCCCNMTAALPPIVAVPVPVAAESLSTAGIVVTTPAPPAP